jgi:hypothetical protein
MEEVWGIRRCCGFIYSKGIEAIATWRDVSAFKRFAETSSVNFFGSEVSLSRNYVTGI